MDAGFQESRCSPPIFLWLLRHLDYFPQLPDSPYLLTAVALWTGVRENYIAELKKAMKAALDEVEWDDEDSDEIRQRKGT